MEFLFLTAIEIPWFRGTHQLSNRWCICEFQILYLLRNFATTWTSLTHKERPLQLKAHSADLSENHFLFGSSLSFSSAQLSSAWLGSSRFLVNLGRESGFAVCKQWQCLQPQINRKHKSWCRHGSQGHGLLKKKNVGHNLEIQCNTFEVFVSRSVVVFFIFSETTSGKPCLDHPKTLHWSHKRSIFSSLLVAYCKNTLLDLPHVLRGRNQNLIRGIVSEGL